MYEADTCQRVLKFWLVLVANSSFTMSERTPLLHYRLSTNVNEQLGEHQPCLSGETVEQSLAFSRLKSAHHSRPKKLSTFFGVVIPTLLSMFSVVVFLRIGEYSLRLFITMSGEYSLPLFMTVSTTYLYFRPMLVHLSQLLPGNPTLNSIEFFIEHKLEFESGKLTLTISTSQNVK